MSDWKEKTLGNLIDVKHGWAFKGEFFSDNPTENVLLTPVNFHIGGGFKDDKFKYYDGDFPKEYILKAGDVIVTMTDLSKDGDTLGYSAKIPKSNKSFLHNQRLGLVISLSQDIDINFIHWLLRTRNYQKTIVGSCSGSTVKHTSPTKIRDYVFLLPPLEEQKQIADVLSCLDAKIENLRRQNETLEAIAQTLFKHWFIDFEFPDADGKPYKSSGGEMVDSAIGDIPEGWEAGKLEDLITVNPRESIKSGQIVKYVDMRALSTSSMEVTGYVTREFTSGSKFRNEDILLARITPCLENGKTAFVSILDSNEVAFGSTEFIVLRAKENCCPEYIYPLARSPYFRDFAVKNMTGTSGRQRIPNDVILNYKLSIPDIETIKRYQKLSRPLFLKTNANHKQIQTLTKTRDALLPKLMSGQLRVKE